MSFRFRNWVRSLSARPGTARRPAPTARLGLTAFEDRSVPATVTLAGGLLSITGNSGSDAIVLAGSNAAGYTLTVDGVPVTDADLTSGAVASIRIDGGSGAASDTLDAAGVTDRGVTLFGNNGNDTLIGSPQADVLDGGANTDTVFGGGGDDTIRVNSDNGSYDESFYGEAGDDIFVISGSTAGAGDLFDGGAGTDTVVNVSAAAAFSLQGTTFASVATLDGNNKAIAGSNSGRDNVNLTGVHTLLNVTGADFLAQADKLTTAVVHAGVVTAYNGGTGGVNADAIAIRLSPAQLAGLSTAELGTLQGYVAAPAGKTLSIGSLNFTATGFETAGVTVAVGEANFPLPNAAFVGVVNVVAQDGGTIRGTAGVDLLINTGAKAATLIGYGSADLLIGGTGADVLQGGNPGGGDVRGTDGADTLFGGDGDDVIQNSWAEGTFDVIDGGLGTDTVQQMQNTSDPQRFSNFTPANGIERLLNGGSVRGTAGDDVLDLSGITDWDLVNGSRTVMGEDGNDTITLPSIPGLGFRALAGAGNDVVNGGSGDDTIDGGSGDDALFGNAGDDYLRGGAGVNTVSGGAGADTFFMHNIFEGTANQTISDFTDASAGEDKLKFQNLNIAANGVAVVDGSTVITFTNGRTLTLLGYTGELDRGTAGDGEAEIVFGTW